MSAASEPNPAAAEIRDRVMARVPRHWPSEIREQVDHLVELAARLAWIDGKAAGAEAMGEAWVRSVRCAAEAEALSC